jgi:hypothetical protein
MSGNVKIRTVNENSKLTRIVKTTIVHESAKLLTGRERVVGLAILNDAETGKYLVRFEHPFEGVFHGNKEKAHFG